MEEILRQVASYLEQRAVGELLENPLPGVCPLAVRTDGVLAYFRVTQKERLQHDWQETQARIAGMPADHYPLHRVFLTLLVTDSDRAWPDWQPIVRDLRVCRKVIVPTDRHEVAEWVEDLPFLPIPDEAVEPRAVITPAHALYQAGFKAELADRLLNQTSAATLARHFREQRVLHQPGDPAPGEMLLTPRESHRRLKRVELENFRPFARTLTLPAAGELGDLTVVYGPNGSGKSSLAQALEWGVIGEVESLEESHADTRIPDKIPPYINVYHPDQPARVRLVMADEHSEEELPFERAVTRSGTMRWQGTALRNQNQALTEILDASLPVLPHNRTLKAMARHSHFLDQENIQDFLSRSAGERYEALANMVGTVDFGRALKKLSRVREAEEEERDAAGARKWEAAARLESEDRVLQDLKRQLEQVDSSPGGALDLSRTAAELRQTALSLNLPVHGEPPSDEGLPAFVLSLKSGLSAVRDGLRGRLEQLIAIAAEEETVGLARAAVDRYSSDMVSLLAEQEKGEHRRRRGQEEVAGAGERVRKAEAARGTAERQLKEANDGLGRIRALAETARRREMALISEDEARESLRAAVEAEEAATGQAEAAVARWETLAHRQRLWQARRAALSEMQGALFRLEFAIPLQTRARKGAPGLSERQKSLRERFAVLKNEVAQAEERVREKSGTLSRLQERVAERQRLLGAMTEYLEGSRCPLCNHDWETAGQLYEQVQAALQDTPEELLPAQQALAGEAARLDGLKAELEQVEMKQRAADADLEQLRRDEERARGIIDEWLNMASNAGLEVRLPLSDPAALLERWHDQLWESDASGLLAEAEKEMTDRKREAGDAAARRVAVEQTLSKAAAALAEAEEAYRRADHAAPAEVSRPQPTGEQLREAEARCGALTLAFAAASRALSEAQEELKKAEAAEREARRALESLAERRKDLEQAIRAGHQAVLAHEEKLAALGLEPIRAALEAELANVRARLSQLERLEEKAKWLDGAIHVRALQEAIAVAERRLEAAHKAMFEAQAEQVRHEAALALIDQATEALDAARAREQNARLAYYEPTINEIYQRINPHPFFPQLKWQPSAETSELTMHAASGDGSKRLPVQQYFSMAQANVVALSIFLGSALLQSWSGLRLICIDDPIQQMDDLNTVAFLDILHAVIQRGRQIVLTTANKEFYQLMLRRYAYLNREQKARFRAFRLRTVNLKDGPDMAEDTPVFLPNGRVHLGPVH